MQTLFVPVERRDDEPGADVDGVLQRRQCPALPKFAGAATRDGQVDQRRRERETGAGEEHDCRPEFDVFRPRRRRPLPSRFRSAGQGFGGLEFEEHKDHDGEHDCAEQSAGDFGRDLEDAEPPFQCF